MRAALLASLAALSAGLRIGGEVVDGESPYFWPSARGKVNAYGLSAFEGPSNLSSSLSWEWHHPTSRYHTITLGTLIDDKRNVYLAAYDAIRKFNVEGDLLWKWTPPEESNLPTIPCLYQGALYGTTTGGQAYALSMLTGEELWMTRVALRNAETGTVQAANGVVVLSADAVAPQYTNRLVVGLNSVDGSHLWEFRPDAPIGNFLPLFVGDVKKPSFVFQDMEGRAYRNIIATGALKWKNGGHNGTWTDGSLMYGNRMIYSVTLYGCCCGTCPGDIQGMEEKSQGILSAHRLQDGSIAWKQKVFRPPNVIPAVGRLRPNGNNVVVMPIGRQCGPLSPTDMWVFDADSGDTQWHLSGGRNPHLSCAGELDGLQYRKDNNLRERCNPPPWSSPTIDAKGTIYVGNQDGNLYTMQQREDGSGFISSKIDVSAAFTSPGSAHAPGMMAVTSCDGLYVFSSKVTKTDRDALPRATTILSASVEEDTSPAALYAKKAAATHPDKQAWNREKLMLDREMVARLQKVRDQEQKGVRTALTRSAALRASIMGDDPEKGDDAGLPEGLLD